MTKHVRCNRLEMAELIHKLRSQGAKFSYDAGASRNNRMVSFRRGTGWRHYSLSLEGGTE